MKFGLDREDAQEFEWKGLSGCSDCSEGTGMLLKKLGVESIKFYVYTT